MGADAEHPNDQNMQSYGLGKLDGDTAESIDKHLSRTDHGPTLFIATPPADAMPPGLAGHPDYDVISELGRGRMGVVYLAHNRLRGATSAQGDEPAHHGAARIDGAFSRGDPRGRTAPAPEHRDGLFGAPIT